MICIFGPVNFIIIILIVLLIRRKLLENILTNLNRICMLYIKYLDNLRLYKLNISKKVVIDYVNTLPPQRLMYSVNYKLKQNVVDEHILNVQTNV